jgi:hypothetical protein
MTLKPKLGNWNKAEEELQEFRTEAVGEKYI